MTWILWPWKICAEASEEEDSESKPEGPLHSGPFSVLPAADEQREDGVLPARLGKNRTEIQLPFGRRHRMQNLDPIQ